MMQRPEPAEGGSIYAGPVVRPSNGSSGVRSLAVSVGEFRPHPDGPREASYEVRAEPVDEMLFVGGDLVLRNLGELSGTRPAKRPHRAPSPR